MRRLGWEMPVEESQEAMEASKTAESYIEGGAMIIASLSTGQHWQLNNREAGPSST